MNTTDNTDLMIVVDFDSVSQSDQGRQVQTIARRMLRRPEVVEDIIQQAREAFADIQWSKLGFGPDEWFQIFVVCNSLRHLKAQVVDAAPRAKVPWYRKLFSAARANANT
jgi:hypothetical protein